MISKASSSQASKRFPNIMSNDVQEIKMCDEHEGENW